METLLKRGCFTINTYLERSAIAVENDSAIAYFIYLISRASTFLRLLLNFLLIGFDSIKCINNESGSVNNPSLFHIFRFLISYFTSVNMLATK